MIEERVALPGATLWTVRQGAGPPLVWCYGGPGLWDYLGPVAAMTDDLCTVYRYDQRACGRSGGNGPHTVARNVADLEGLRVHWGLERWVVAGHSWGASLALHYALSHPGRTAALIYLSGTGVNPAWSADYRAERDRRLGPSGVRERLELAGRWAREGTLEAERAYCEVAWSTDFSDARQGRVLARQLLMGELRVNAAVNRELHADSERELGSEVVRRKVKTLNVPALIVHGVQDPRPAWAARELTELLPLSTFALLPNVGHSPWLERPEALRTVLRHFLRTLPQPP